MEVEDEAHDINTLPLVSHMNLEYKGLLKSEDEPEKEQSKASKASKVCCNIELHYFRFEKLLLKKKALKGKKALKTLKTFDIR